MCTCIYDCYNLPEVCLVPMVPDWALSLNSSQPGLVVMTISSTNGSTLFDSDILITTRCASLWFSFYSNLTLILLEYSLAKYLLRRI